MVAVKNNIFYTHTHSGRQGRRCKLRQYLKIKGHYGNRKHFNSKPILDYLI